VDSNTVRQRWARRSGEFSPRYYAYYGPNETSEQVRASLDAAVGPEAAVLELGCSSGRHLAHLHEQGYEDLHGIEINDDAFEVMDENYPDLAADGTFYCDAIESAVTDFDDGRFDAVFSVETLQHLHPDDEWVFAELCRITDDCLVTVENEGDEEDRERGALDVKYVDDFPLYFRDWNRVFTDLGFVEVGAKSVGNDTLRTFRPAEN
jgi:SAM-dependent methyltransferase